MKIHIIEGIDGSGKSTASRFIKSLFLDKKVIELREPDGYFRNILTEAASTRDMSLFDEWMCFWLSRFDLWMNQILPFVNEDVVVIIDRSFVSTYAYQIYGRGLGQDFEKSFYFWKKELLNLFTDKEMIQIHHIYMRASVDIAQARISSRPSKAGDLTQFEAEDMQKRVKSGFDIYYNNKSNLASFEDVVVINANNSIEDVNNELGDKLSCSR